MNLVAQMKDDRLKIEAHLDGLTGYPPGIMQNTVVEAARYSLLGGGKRIRAFLVLEICRTLGGCDQQALPAACAVEMVHAYSLIHDDLPCMDDDDYRRGKPSCHKKFGEAIAVLAGDALLTYAFETLSSNESQNIMGLDKAFKCMCILSRRSGVYGMLGGQTIDVLHENKKLNAMEHQNMVRLKTGALIKASAEMGCICANADAKTTAIICDFAALIGEAFQISDDILDITGDIGLLGKPTGSDEKSHKNTFVTSLGLKNAKLRANELFGEAQATIGKLHHTNSLLPEFVDYLSERKQ